MEENKTSSNKIYRKLYVPSALETKFKDALQKNELSNHFTSVVIFGEKNRNKVDLIDHLLKAESSSKMSQSKSKGLMITDLGLPVDDSIPNLIEMFHTL